LSNRTQLFATVIHEKVNMPHLHWFQIVKIGPGSYCNLYERNPNLRWVEDNFLKMRNDIPVLPPVLSNPVLPPSNPVPLPVNPVWPVDWKSEVRIWVKLNVNHQSKLLWKMRWHDDWPCPLLKFWVSPPSPPVPPDLKPLSLIEVVWPPRPWALS
jgi:hypothetical protein